MSEKQIFTIPNIFAPSPEDHPMAKVDTLSGKEREKYLEYMEKMGYLSPKDSGLGELPQRFMGSSVQALRGIGATAEEFGLGDGAKGYFQSILNRNQQWNQPEESSPVGYVAGAVGSALGSTAVIAPAMVADAMFGTKGVATFATVFSQSLGENIQRNRAVYGQENEEKSIGLAAVESSLDALTEVALGTVPMLGKILKGRSVAGKRQLVKEMFREAEKELGRSGAKRFFLGVAENGLEEGAEEAIQYVNSWAFRALGGDPTNKFNVGEIADAMAQGAIGGAALGMIGGANSVNTYGKQRNWLPGASKIPGMPSPVVPGVPEAAVGVPSAPDEASVNLVSAVAEELGMNVRFFDEEGAPEAKTADGNPVNGFYDSEKKEFWIDRADPNMNPLETLGHEFYHANDKLFRQFNELINSGINEEGKKSLASTEEDYAKAGMPGAGLTEFNADTFGKMWTDPQFWSEVTERAEKMNAGMGQKMLDALQEFIKTVRAKLKEIGTPEAKQLFDNMGELRKEAVRITADIKRRNGTSTQAENVVGVQGSNLVTSVPVADINVDPARFQFKSKANKITGVDESNQIGGEWDERTAGNLYIWEDKTGKKFVVNGHHRLALAKSKNVQNVNAIIDREVDGVTAEQARRNGTLINIRDGQGDVRDYAAFVRSSKLDEESAQNEGVLSRAKGRTGYLIGRYASDNLYSMYRNGDISDSKTATIADITRGDEALEAAGIRAAKGNMPNSQLREFLKLLKNTPKTKSTQGDLFGFDDSAIKTAEALSKLAAKHINQIKNAINSGKGAIKNPEGASKINVHAGEDSEKLLQEARQDLDRWEHWSTDKELYQQLVKEAGLAEAPKPAPAKTESPKNDGRFNIDSDTPLLTPEEDANDFQLIPESSKDADKRAAAKAKADKEASDRAKQKAKEATPELGMTENTPVEKPERKSGYEVHVQNNGSVTIERYEIMPNGVPVLDGNSVIKAKDAQEALDIIENNRLPVPDRDLQKLKTVAEQTKPIIQDSTPEKAWGSENKIVSRDQYEAAKQRMKDRLKNLNMGLDPGILSDGAVMASYHIEAGARKFTDFTKRMMDDLGEGIKPYLKSIYESARRMPGMEDVAKDMDSTQDVDAFNFDAPQTESKDLPSVLREVIDMDASGQVKQQRLIRLAKSFNISAKEIQERCEAEVVAMGREINAENISDDAKYQKLIDLYDRQPNFSKRTSTSVANQAYSTPVPLAWILGKRIGLAGNSVYEPTAGTGMLTIAGDVHLTSVNEIDTLRRDILSKQGFKSVTSKDAVDGHPNKTFDRVIMNPPFGAGNMKVFDGYKLSKIDHIIAAEALKALSDNGRAAIIIGANTEGRGGVGKATLQDHIFMSYLYDKFNVKDNYIVSGDLYRKQGAGYPVRVLTLDGRRTTSENIDHPTDIEIVKDWDTLYNNLKGELEHGTLPETERSDSVDRIGKHPDTQGQNAPNGRRHSGGNGSSLDANSVASGENSRSSGVLGERNEQLPKGRGSLGTNQPQGSVLPESAQSGSSVRSGVGNSTGSLPLSSGNAGNTTGNQSDTGRSGSERSGLPVSDGRQSVSSSAPSEGIQVGEERGELNNTYKPASKNPTDQMDVVIPRYMADAVAQALTRLKDKVGDIDAYVQKELAYETPEELYKALADVQIDGVALAIQAIRNHTGFVLGDQTGIGKGRQCAAMIRWAQKHDITPVFFTADQNLFTDMYRDGKDIGNVFNPLIMASEKKTAQITDADGKVIIPLLSARKQDEAFQSLMNDSSKHDVVFTSYSQLSSSRGRQHRILRDLVDNQKCLFIMDEAHKASGDSAVGRFFNGILSNPNVEVLYASATFAKRPDNMSLYFRTNISKALDNEEKLMSVLTRGGVPLQQILSQGLALDGQYTRRERDFTGVTFDMVMAEPIDKETGKVDKIAKADLVTTYNRVAEVLKKLVDYNEAVKKAIKTAHKGDYTTTGQREKLAVEMATFASTSHNFVAQLLLASKCNICVQQAVNAFKKGQKPVIALTNTLEANLKDFVKSAGLAVNDPLPMKFAHILENAVWRMYHFSMKAKTGEKTVITFKPEDYGLGEAHKKIMDQIHGLDDVDLPISPIDYIKDQLERNGVRTAEITGRTYTVDYSKAVPVLSKREADDKNKNKIVNDFNSGKIDAVILNSSGSTGLSIHAAAWFKDQRARRMELAQPSLDIAIVMQTLGRINRTGQVVKPSYSFLSSPLNAEKRQFMVLSRKLQSLNANTTANNKSDIELGDDIINKYGDIVAQQFINENPDIAMTLNLDNEIQEEGSQAKPTEDLIVKLTGRMTLLPDEMQGEIYEDLSARYNDLVEYLRRIGDYDLEISIHDDWDVISGEETELAPGDPNGSIFEQPVKMKQISLSEKYSIQPAADIRNKIKENLGADRNEVVERLKNDLADINSAIENLAQAYEGSDRKPEYIDDRQMMLRNTLNLFENFMIRNTNEMLEINIGEESYDGTIIGYRGTKKFNPRRPIIPSKIMIDFAIAGKIGKISIPYSRILNGEVTYGKSLYGIEHYFTGQKVNIRSDRYAITGNLMRGLEYTNAGKVVTYKTNKGEIETGLLMPKTWQPGQLVRDPRNEIHTTREAMDHLLTNQGNISSNDGLNIIRSYDSFVIEVPKSRKQGGKYYLDQELVRITGDFASSRNVMRTLPLEEKALEVAIAYLLTKKDTILKKVDKKYSLKRHHQVNPIRQAGEVQDQHEALINEKYETRSNKVVNEEAEQRLAGNGGMDGTIRMMLDGDFNIGSDVSQRVMQVVLNSDEFKELDVNDREKISDLYINAAGTDVARSLAARRLGVLDMEDIKSIQAHVNAFMAKIDKGKPYNDLRKRIMEEFGFDIDNLPDSIVDNPDLLDALIRKMVSERAGKFDKWYEFWINSILSAPTTHVANIIGNAANAGYELGLKRLAEAAINVVAKRKDAATFKEFKEITRAVNWSDAFQRAKRAFDLETLTTTGKLEYARASIGGKTGRIIRLPGRLLRAADEFAKAIVQPMEAVAYAYRQGENLSLKGADLQAFIEKQLAKPKSAANVFGNSRALELTFQENPGKAVNQLMQWREAGGLFGTLLKFTLPFVKTPANILRQGIRKSPLGSISLAYDAAQVAMGKKKFSKEQISQIAEQLLAWGAVAMLAGMGDDDDDMPFLTGSSPRYGSAEQKFKANKVPPYSIRVGENYYSYKRIEPLSTGLAFIADGLAAYRSAKNGEDGTRIMKRLIGGVKQLVVEKSFLDSLGEINKIATDPERSGLNALSNFASSWMPNLVRQTVNVFDDNVRDNKSRAKGIQWWEDQFQIVTNRMGITKAAPKYDYFGREIQKDSLADSGVAWKLMRMIPIQSIKPDENMNRAETLIWRYNQAHPGEEYYPNIPAYYFQREGKKLYFEGENYTTFVQRSGQIALKQINNAFRHGLLDSNKPTEKDIQLIKNIFAKARKIVRDDMYKKRQYSE